MADLSAVDEHFLDLVYYGAVRAGLDGNVPVAALITAGRGVIAEGTNRSLAPALHPGRHAEVEALRAVPDDLWPISRTLTLYTTLEPCVMCFGAIVMHRLGRVVFAASDHLGGVVRMIPLLPEYVRAKAQEIEWVGPVGQDRFRTLAARALELRSVRSPVALVP